MTPSILGVHSCPLCLTLLPTSLPATASPPAPAPQPRGHQLALGSAPSRPSLLFTFLTGASPPAASATPVPTCAHTWAEGPASPILVNRAHRSLLPSPVPSPLRRHTCLVLGAHSVPEPMPPHPTASQPLVSGTVLTQHARSTCPCTASTAGTPGCSQGHIGHF